MGYYDYVFGLGVVRASVSLRGGAHRRGYAGPLPSQVQQCTDIITHMP